MFIVKKLYVSINEKPILKGLNLNVKKGSLHVLIGPNGSGKSTFASAVSASPEIDITNGEILFDKKNIVGLSADKISQLGIFVAFQYPIEVTGVDFMTFLRLAYNSHVKESKRLPMFKFRKLVLSKATDLGIKSSLLKRNLNEGLSGGEKKKMEILQLAVLQPQVAILDETDSGLDVDAIKSIFVGIEKIRKSNPQMSIIVITHYDRVFTYLKPDFVHMIKNGKIAQTGDKKFGENILNKGFK